MAREQATHLVATTYVKKKKGSAGGRFFKPGAEIDPDMLDPVRLASLTETGEIKRKRKE